MQNEEEQRKPKQQLSRYKRFDLARSAFSVAAYVIYVAVMLSMGRGNIVLNCIMLGATLVYLGFFFALYFYDQGNYKVQKRGRFIYRYARRVLRLIGLGFTFVGFINVNLTEDQLFPLLFAIYSLLNIIIQTILDVLTWLVKRQLRLMKAAVAARIALEREALSSAASIGTLSRFVSDRAKKLRERLKAGKSDKDATLPGEGKIT